ncbi:ribulose 1,5-bisphosphate carboxylase large subunit, partial [Rhodococcus hoagii]|nr:ribulose 1,5-bisphosphate carboxylase large subunit [Prescottella equi]
MPLLPNPLQLVSTVQKAAQSSLQWSVDTAV